MLKETLGKLFHLLVVYKYTGLELRLDVSVKANRVILKRGFVKVN